VTLLDRRSADYSLGPEPLELLHAFAFLLGRRVNVSHRHLNARMPEGNCKESSVDCGSNPDSGLTVRPTWLDYEFRAFRKQGITRLQRRLKEYLAAMGRVRRYS
jgi:hypothetical protein